jgi:hypothetical protein
MTTYSNNEISNEVSKIFRATIKPSKIGGVTNISEEYAQLMEMASSTLLLYPDSIFYLAKLSCNILVASVATEVALLEDMLAALESYSKVGTAVRNTSALSNASTALLALDASTSVTNRPETKRFVQSIDQYTGDIRKNVYSINNGDLFKPREVSRLIIVSDLAKVKEVHAALLSSLDSLRNLLTNYTNLNLPAKVSSTTFLRIRENLDTLKNSVETTTDPGNIALSWEALLTSLAGKASVNVVSQFADPNKIKYRGPTNPIPATMNYSGRVTGTGTPATVLTSSGPWKLPLGAPLTLTVDGGSPQSLDLTRGPSAPLTSLSDGPYIINSARRNLHVIIDPTVYTTTISSVDFSGTLASTQSRIPLTFKNLGALVRFPTAPGTDSAYRAITSLWPLQSGTLASYNSSNGMITCTGMGPLAETTLLGLDIRHLGYYVRDAAAQVFELIEVPYSGNTAALSMARIDDRGLTPALGSMVLIGEKNTGTLSFFAFAAPVINFAGLTGQPVEVGPTIKTAQLTAGTWTAAQLVTQIQSELGVFQSWNTGASIHKHIKARTSLQNSNRLVLSTRSNLTPYLKVSDSFLNPQNPVADPVLVKESVNYDLSLPLGGVPDSIIGKDNVLNPVDLVSLINNSIQGVSASAVNTTIPFSSTLTLPNGNNLANCSGSTEGSQAGDLLHVLSGPLSGVYKITGIYNNIFILDTPFRTISDSNVPFKVTRQQVQIQSLNTGRGSSLQVSAPVSFACDGTYYGSVPQFEAVNKQGESFPFSNVVPGDLLRVIGSRTYYTVGSVNDTILTLDPGLPSNTNEAAFEIQSAGSIKYQELVASLDEITTSPNLLKKNKFDQDLSALDAAISSAISPGQNLVSTKNQAQRLIADLLSVLSTTYTQSSNYSTQVPIAALNIEATLRKYEAVTIANVDSMIEAFIDRKYNRAVDLLKQGNITEFFSTNERTGSYSGAMLEASRKVNLDLPADPSVYSSVNERVHVATSVTEGPDGEYDFSDTEGFELDDI